MAGKKGQSGNPAGRPIGSGDKQFVEQLRIVLAELCPMIRRASASSGVRCGA